MRLATGCAVKVTCLSRRKDGRIDGERRHRVCGGAVNWAAAAPPETVSGRSASVATRVWPYFTLSKVTSATSPVIVESASGGWSSAQMLRKVNPCSAGLLLLHLHQRVPVVEKQILKGVVGVVAPGAVRAPEAEQPKRLAAGADAAVQNVGVAQGEVARVEDLSRPAGAHDVRDAGRELAVLDQDVLHVVAGAQHVVVGVAVPVALHRKDVVRGAQEGSRARCVSPPPSQSMPSWLALPGLPPITRRSSYVNPVESFIWIDQVRERTMQVSPSISTLWASSAPMQCQSGFCIQPSSVLGSCGPS